MRAKEWLKANGFPDIPLGKGRLSNEQRAAVEAAVARGVRIDGYAVKDTTSTPKVERVAPDTNVIADIGEPLRDERYNRAFVGTRDIGMRAVCNNCNQSLTYCPCESPIVWGYGVDTDTPSVVTFKLRPNPETYRPNKWW